MSVLNKLNMRQCGRCFGMMLFAITVCLAGPIMAKDTDVYQVNTKNNCMVLMDTSGSMEWAAYEYTQNYAQVYDYFYDIANVDDVVVGNALYGNHVASDKIYLIRGDVGVSTATIDGDLVAFHGDAGAASEWDSGNTYITWQFTSVVDTNTLIDASRNLLPAGGGTQRLTIDPQGYILFDGSRLPLGQDILAKNEVELFDGSIVDNGFGGMLEAPGVYFSGYEGVSPTLNTAESGDDDIYFFVTGNWINLQSIFNLEFTSGTNDGEPAWVHEEYPLSGGGTTGWQELSKAVEYPVGADYVPGEKFRNNKKTIKHAGALKIRLHFSEFDVYDDGANTRDSVVLKDASNTVIIRYDNGDVPADGWSPIVDGDTINVGLRSDADSNVGSGYKIDKIEVLETVDGAGGAVDKIKTRLEVAVKAFGDVLDAPDFKGKMNWGFATFDNGDGARIRYALDPSAADDTQVSDIHTILDNTTASGGTPLGEALQDVFKEGFFDRKAVLGDVECRKSYIISMTDGYPSADTQWSRIGGVTFTDADGDGWTTDPVQSSNPDPDYYDDVAHWIYTHSWKDKSLVAYPENSYENAASHHIAFGSHSPILRDAAGESGGVYTAAFNQAQLKAAFYSLALSMTDAVAFTAPVVSVDAANKIQNGDDLYLGLFLPQDKNGWVGNLKKFRLGDGIASGPRPDIWMLYDGANNPAIDDDGNFLDNRAAFWADDSDANDADNFGGHDVKEDGVGEVLSERVAANFSASNFYERPIYTYLNGTMTEFEPGNALITQATLGVSSTEIRNQVINYVHGYSNETVAAADSDPKRVREWALGSIVHSSPVVVDYFDPSDFTILEKRYIVVGANDGMLHVFDDADGKELFAFIPPNILSSLKSLPTEKMVDLVDGDITVYRQDKKPKYLIFGLRRGGDQYWCLDVSDTNPLNWNVKWSYSHSEMGESWSKPQIASIPVGIDSSTGEVDFKDIVLFAGGYDTLEDSFPEPFNDQDNNGNPFAADGSVLINEWDDTDNAQDVQDNDVYDRYNPGMDTVGRGLFAVDIEDPNNVSTVGSDKVLPFSVTYGAADVTSGNVQTLTSMKFCFPATPSVVTTSFAYYYKDAGKIKEGRKTNVLDAIYATDIYANLYKLNYRFEIKENSGSYSVGERGWVATRVFAGNPGSLSRSGETGQGIDNTDQGRKAFYSPAISWGGACDYFDAGNYVYPGTTFSGQFDIAALYFGTGDREHPTYSMIRNRLYAVYDDTSVSADDGSTVVVGTAPYSEDSLLNLSCDELDVDTILSGVDKDDLKELLLDDPVYLVGATPTLEDGSTNEDDAKGWYIILEDQGDSIACSHCTYPNAPTNADLNNRDNHDNEKILSRVGLFAGVLYFTSYQPAKVDKCNPQGNGFAYSLNYCDATAAYNTNESNDDGSTARKDVTDRYKKINKIYGIPSEFAIITRKGRAGAMAMAGGKIIGPKKDNDFQIKAPGMGLELYYWREGNSQIIP